MRLAKALSEARYAYGERRYSVRPMERNVSCGFAGSTNPKSCNSSSFDFSPYEMYVCSPLFRAALAVRTKALRLPSYAQALDAPERRG